MSNNKLRGYNPPIDTYERDRWMNDLLGFEPDCDMSAASYIAILEHALVELHKRVTRLEDRGQWT
jgi:hypothetical protein